MTTIAFDGKTLAADSQGGCNFVKEAHQFKKIFEVGEFYIAGYRRSSAGQTHG